MPSYLSQITGNLQPRPRGGRSFLARIQSEPEPADEFGWFDTAITTGLRIVPSVLGTWGGGAGGALLGGAGGAAAGAPAAGVGAVPGGIAGLLTGAGAGAAAGGAAGSALGEWLAQEYEQYRGARKDIDPSAIGIEAGLGAIPLGKSATLLKAAAKGAGMGVAGAGLHQYAEEGELDPGRLGLSALLGGAFGAGGEAISRRLGGKPAEALPARTGDDIEFVPEARVHQGQRGSGSYLKYLQADAAIQRLADDTPPWSDELDLVSRQRSADVDAGLAPPPRARGYGDMDLTPEDFVQPLRNDEDPWAWETLARERDAADRVAAAEAAQQTERDAFRARLEAMGRERTAAREAIEREAAALQRQGDVDEFGAGVTALERERAQPAVDAIERHTAEQLKLNEELRSVGIDHPITREQFDEAIASVEHVEDWDAALNQIREYAKRWDPVEVARQQEQADAMREILRGEGSDHVGDARRFLESVARAGGLQTGAKAGVHDLSGELAHAGGFRDGLFGAVQGVRGVFRRDAESAEKLAEALREAGWDVPSGSAAVEAYEQAVRNLSGDFKPMPMPRRGGAWAHDERGTGNANRRGNSGMAPIFVAQHLAGGAAGAAAGGTQGDTPEERWRNAALAGLLGLGGAAAVIKGGGKLGSLFGGRKAELVKKLGSDVIDERTGRPWSETFAKLRAEDNPEYPGLRRLMKPVTKEAKAREQKRDSVMRELFRKERADEKAGLAQWHADTQKEYDALPAAERKRLTLDEYRAREAEREQSAIDAVLEETDDDVGYRAERDAELAANEAADKQLRAEYEKRPAKQKDLDYYTWLFRRDQRGEVSAELAHGLAGAAAGGLAGATQGDTPEEHAGYAALGAALGAGGGAGLSRFLSSRAARKAAAEATSTELTPGVEHKVVGPRGVPDTAEGINPEAKVQIKAIKTPTGMYTEEGLRGTFNPKTGEVRKARENEVLRFMGGDTPKAQRMPKAQREELGIHHFPDELQEGVEDVVTDVIGGGDTKRALDIIERQRRGRQPNARTTALANHMALSTQDKLAPGTNLPAAGHAAYGNAVASVQDKLRSLGQKIQNAGGTDQDLLELGRLNAAQRVLFLSHQGLRSEAGRALQIYKAMRRVMPSEIRMVRELLDRGRLRNDLVDLSKIMADLDTDPVKAFEQLRKAESRSVGQRVADYYMANILSGIKTQERNIFGNASKLAARVMVKAGTGGLDALSAMMSGKPREVYSSEVLHEVQGGLANIGKAWEDFTETLRLGFSPTAIREGLEPEGTVYLPKQEMPGGGANPLNYPGRLLEAADRFFRQVNGSMELYGLTYSAARKQAEKEGLKGAAFDSRIADLTTGMRLNPSAELKQQIQEAAARSTFQEDPGKAINTLIGLKKHVPALNYVIPFVRTVSNIMKQGAEHTPLGFFMKRARQSDDLREQTIARGEAAMGTLALAPLAYLAATGKISGSGPKDPAERARLYESGWRPNSIQLGDRWVSYTLAQPFSIPLSVVANGFEAWRDASADATEKTKLQNAEGIAAQTIARVGKSALDQSFLSGLGDLVKAINDPERASSGFFARLATGFVPLSGLQRNIAQAIDPTVRQPTGVAESVLSGIPGASMMVQPRLTRFGEEAQRERQSALFVPEVSPTIDDPVAGELARLGLDVGLPTDRINFKEFAPGARQLTGDESFNLRQTRGRATRVILSSIMNQPGYANLPDVLKAELLRRTLRDSMTDVNDVARIAIQGGRPELLQQLSDPLEELAAATYQR